MSSYYGSEDPHSRSAFVPKAEPSYGSDVDPWADLAVVPPPEHSAVRPLEQLSGVNSNHACDESDDPHSMSAFVHKDDSARVIDPHRNSRSSNHIRDLPGEPTVKQLLPKKALIVPETTTIYEACCRMDSESADALVITDSNALLIGILTYKDIVRRGIARELDLVNTVVSKVMTKNPTFVTSDTLAAKALVKMYEGHFDQLPVVENGEVVGIVNQQLYSAQVVLAMTIENDDITGVTANALEKLWRIVGKYDKGTS